MIVVHIDQRMERANAAVIAFLKDFVNKFARKYAATMLTIIAI